MSVATKENPVPFTMQFQEKIPKKDIIKIEGKYDEKKQQWKWPQNQSLDMSFPGGERPTTTCTVATRITPSITRSDMGVDD